MKPASRIASLLAGAVLLASAPAWSAEQEERAGVAEQMAVLIMSPDLQGLIAAATEYPKSSVEVSSANHQMTIGMVNGTLNSGSRGERNAEAGRITSLVAKTMAGRPEFADVLVIHVDFIQRLGDHSTVVQAIDFRKAPNGTFEFHVT